MDTTDRLDKIYAQVKALYDNADEAYLREWFFDGHVDYVMKRAIQIAGREGGNTDIAALAALLHDLARVTGFQHDPELMDESLKMTQQIMAQHQYSQTDIDHVCDIIKVHSCRGDNRPTCIEGKVMVTADALAHLMTDFFLVFGFHNEWLYSCNDFESYKIWVAKKVERDFKNKIQFEQERQEALPRYNALLTIFS